MDLSDNISYIINHLFLPPNVPQKDDMEFNSQNALLSHVVESTTAFYQALNRSEVDEHVRQGWHTLHKMVLSMQNVRQGPLINLQSLLDVVKKMENGDILCLLISKQNAGVILRKLKTEVTLEFFPASATAAAVTGNSGKLIMQFPSRPRLSVPHNPLFIKSLCTYLVDMDCTEMPGATPITTKARSDQNECREVPDIRYISELLGGIARAVSSDVNAISSSTVYVSKRINDHVLWQGWLNPWRRDPQWLVLRVALQTSLSELKIDERYGYKIFITYVLARALEKARNAKLSHDLLHTMNVKIATRIWKAQSLIHTGFPFDYITSESQSCRRVLEDQWRDVQELDAQPLPRTIPTRQEIRMAEGFALTKSRAYLSAVYNRTSELQQQSNRFSPETFEATLVNDDLRKTGLSPPIAIPTATTGADLWLAILDVERWASNDLDHWQINTDAETQLEILRQMIIRLDSVAYSLNNPELFSRVFLVILELWVALDKIVINTIPLLKQYSPELSVSSFEPLILPTLCQMKRLRAAEDHLKSRQEEAKYPQHSLFKFINHPDSFPARYFQTSGYLQQLRSNIQSEATKARNDKIQECARRNNEYSRRERENNWREHRYYDWFSRFGLCHPTACLKCLEQEELTRMRIAVFEWPLPEDFVLSQLVVFELHLPKPFGIWRDISYRLARHYSVDFHSTSRQAPTPILSEYPPLQKFFSVQYTSQELMIASNTRSFLESHYRECGFPCVEAAVVKNHALQYELYNVATGTWIPNVFPSIALREKCTPKSLSGKYKSLAWAVSSTSHTPNMVIARQSECPTELSYHEWEAFGHIRSGKRLQWRNMMLELVKGTVTLGDPTVHLLFRQAAWQVEKGSDVDYRESHIDLAEEAFGKEVVEVLRGRLDRICDNWKEGWTASTLSILACRLFSLSKSTAVQQDVLEFLSSLRLTVEKWLNQIIQLLKQVDSTENISIDMRNRVIQLAVTCRSTFALGYKVSCLFMDPKSISTFVKCAIVLQNNVPGELATLPTHLRYLVEGDIVLSVQVMDILIRSILSNDEGLEDAIRFVWQGFRRDPSIPWRSISDRWIACKTFAQGDTDRACYAHYNLLDGTFLVDGKTIGNLPKSILQHPLFQSVFPSKFMMDIVPSTMKGMEYQLSRNVQNQLEIHFAMIGCDLLIRTRDVHSHELSEFISPDKLRGDLPNSLLAGTVFRFHDSSRCLQVYPALPGWDPSISSDWIMQFTADPLETQASPPKLTKATGVEVKIMSPESLLLKKLFVIFQPLEPYITNLLVTWEPLQESTCHLPPYSSGNLRISLPRYRLSFSVGAHGDLECKELPGLSIASRQSFGALFGLKNKLVLESKDGIGRRKVIIPDGEIEINLTPYREIRHPEVTIKLPEIAGLRMKMFIYEVDELIGRLVCDGVLASWYLLTYLHVLTSSYLSDPLTHRTGVQQALTMLKSANSFAFTQLTAEDVKFLRLIHSLTPVRNYYPHYLTSMEQISWKDVISPILQSELFAPLVETIMGHGSNQALFELTPPGFVVKYRGAVALRERAEVRNSRLISGSEIYRTMSICDVHFSPDRCLGESSTESTEKERIVFRTASLVAKWTTSRDVPPNIWEQFRDWRNFSTRVHPHLSFDSPNAWLSQSPSDTWFSLFSLCLSALKDEDMTGLMFALSILSYRTDLDTRLVHALRAIATNAPSQPFLRAASLLPKDQNFNLSPGHTLRSEEINCIAKRHCIPFESSLQATLVPYTWETVTGAAARREEAYNALRESQCQSIAEYLFEQWPASVAEMPNTYTTYHYSLIDKKPFKEAVQELFSSRFLNRRLFQHAEQLQSALDTIPYCMEDIPLIAPKTPMADTHDPTYVPLSLLDLVRNNGRLVSVTSHSQTTEGDVRDVLSGFTQAPSGTSTQELILRLSRGMSGGFPSRYIADLRRCVNALETRPMLQVNDIQGALLPRTVQEKVLLSAGLWPSLGPDSLLSLLSHHFRREIHHGWQEALIGYAERLAADQRERRIAAVQRPGLRAERVKETANKGGQGWEAAEYLDWLLIQLDANFLIRPVQASIAKEMMSPKGQKNTVMQLNMGEGKSSVIVPIISAALADGNRLVRVVVLKPLCTQMFHLLKQRICGLANRRLYYLPFRRGVSLNACQFHIIRDMHRACARDGGVLLCQPEHILSFQLMGLDLLCNAQDTGKADLFIEEQRWLDSNTRDILDESDEVLNVRYQLIYTLGNPKPLQGQPDRWQIIQNVFSLLKDHLGEAAKMHPEGLELQPVEPHSQYFPRTRILTHECGQNLMVTLAHQIVFEEKMPLTPFRSYPNALRHLALRFVTDLRTTHADSEILEKYSNKYFDQLLLLRGLIAHGIVLFSLKEKRWRVDYGLDTSRSMLAVPYRAKDSPAPRAEFGHPDVTIVLTCLSYYYGGLSDQQLEITFDRLFNSDNPSLRYEDWIKGSVDLPESLRNLQGLNLDDFHQKYHHIFPRLRDNKAVIDFYLSECVFSKEAKEFPYKLTTNSWDLARQKTQFTTGFSGTNDNSYLLPLSIHQLDSEDQRHTNAQVLEYLLRVENRTVVHTGSDITALDLLRRIAEQEPHTTVLLDVGAQVLELQNKDVAREWLKLDTHQSLEAAVYCDSRNDEFYVLTRDGHVEPLERSLYKTQLNKVLVYLDEARTRGTDFKFPIGTRAAVTLGPKMVKDKLVQGCMRMRKLGSDHSVVFFASSEIQRKIQASIGAERDVLDSSDVLVWAIGETWAHIKENGAHWASQGINFDIRRTAWEAYDKNSISASDLAVVLRENESRPLKELYGVREDDAFFTWRMSEDGLSERQQTIQEKCQKYGITLSRSTALLEEQERELAHEKEEERQIEYVIGKSPCEHSVDPALIPFIRLGTTSANFLSLLECLKFTSQGTGIRTTSISFFQSNNLRATEDFSRTIYHKGVEGSLDDFLRSVTWILRSNVKPDMLLLISPFEANELLPEIRRSDSIHLHLYSSRVSRQVRSFEDLNFFVVPPSQDSAPLPSRTIHELNLFSGQLFFYDRPSFRAVCSLLGLHLGEIPEQLEGKVDTVGFVKDKNAREILGIRECAFDESGVQFLRNLLAWRRKGLGYSLTHVGQILYGIDLKHTEFD